MILKDIASDFQNLLGSKYRIYPNTNANAFFDITSNTTIELQQAFSDNWYTAILRKTSGAMVPLKDIFTTSFGYTLDFYVPIDSTVLDDLENLIQVVNGSLQNNGNYTYVMTINEPIPNGIKGTFQIISVTGDIALTNKSLFGNDFKLTIDDYELKGLISASPTLQPKFEGDQQQDGKLHPSFFPDYYQSAISLVLHARKDDAFTMKLIDYVFDADLLFDKEEFKLKFDYFGKTKTWNTAYLTSISFELTIGGYVIVSCGFIRSEAI